MINIVQKNKIVAYYWNNINSVDQLILKHNWSTAFVRFLTKKNYNYLAQVYIKINSVKYIV